MLNRQSQTSPGISKSHMETDIIQHHSHIDFETLFEDIKSRYIGLDCNDYSNFIHTSGEKHSFMGCAECNDRVKNALGKAIASAEAVEIINRASAVLIAIIRSSKAERPLTMEEFRYLSEFTTGLPMNCEIVWSLADDISLGNAVSVILLVKTAK